MSTVTLRPAAPGDESVLKRLAELDSAPPLPGPRVLVAERDGIPLAAICLASGRIVADPFEPTAALLELLRAHVQRSDRIGRPAPTSGAVRLAAPIQRPRTNF
jgi:hypothetical protein